MAVPKRRTGKARKNKRRASSYTLPRVSVMKCPECGEPKRPHRVCPHCGYYNKREVIIVEQ